MQEIFASVHESLPYILGGCAVTVATVCLALALGCIMGIPMALGQVYGGGLMRAAIGFYVWVFRGTPILILLFLLYFGVFWPLLELSAFAASCIVLGLTSAAYQSQIFRGAIQAIPQGQLKAARALGMSDSRGIGFIVMPQALRLALPGWSNEYSILLKDSAMVYLLGTPDIMARIHQMADSTTMHFTYSVTAGVLYCIVTVIGLSLLRRLENRWSVPGYQHV